jgi:hypothetical protein
MIISQHIDIFDIIEWYVNKYNADYGETETILLEWMGIYDGNTRTYIQKTDKESWIKDLFNDVPELKDGILVLYDD